MLSKTWLSMYFLMLKMGLLNNTTFQAKASRLERQAHHRLHRLSPGQQSYQTFGGTTFILFFVLDLIEHF